MRFTVVGMTATPQLSWAQISARRLERSGLGSAPAPGTRPADVADALCGAHAQVLSAAEVSIGLRLPGGTRDDVRDALWVERSLVKTYGPRGTVHLLPTRDLPMWTGALSALPAARSPFTNDVQLSPEQTDEVVAAIAVALADAELTKDELTEAVVAATGPWAGELTMPAFQGFWPRWVQVISVAANRGALCFGANRGRKVTYTNPHRWLPELRPMQGQAALAELLRRYLRAYGPATPAHFARWFTVPKAWAAELFEAVELDQVEVDGTHGWVLAGDTEAPATEPRGVRLLPYFDAYQVASQPRELFFPGRAAERALAGGQAGNFPVLVVDGAVAGVWHQRRSGRRIDFTVEPLAPLAPAQLHELDEQVERVAEILDGRPTLTIGTVTVGPHA